MALTKEELKTVINAIKSNQYTSLVIKNRSASDFSGVILYGPIETVGWDDLVAILNAMHERSRDGNIIHVEIRPTPCSRMDSLYEKYTVPALITAIQAYVLTNLRRKKAFKESAEDNNPFILDKHGKVVNMKKEAVNSPECQVLQSQY